MPKLYSEEIPSFTHQSSFILKLWDLIFWPIAFICKGFKKNAHNPRGPQGHFLLGVLPEFASNPFQFFNSVWKTYGSTDGICQFKVAHKNIYLVTEKSFCQIISSDAETFTRGASFDKNRQVLGTSLLTAEGEVWKFKRREIQHYLNAKVIEEHHFPILRNVSEKTALRWAEMDETTIDVLEEMSKCTIEMISRSLLGIDLSTEMQDGKRALDRILLHVFARVISVLPAKIQDKLPTEANRKYRQAVAIAKRELTKRIEEMKATGEMNYLMKRFTEEGELNEALFNDILNVFLAGYETTAQMLTWTLYELARRPEIHLKLCEEIENAVEGESPTFLEIQNLTYLDKVLQEVLRIYPPAPLFVRDVAKDTQLGRFTLAKGSAVLIGIAQMGQDPTRWYQPLEFYPDRFNEEIIYKTQFDLIPFGAGKHRCVGQQLALIEAKTILGSLLNKFEFELMEPVNPTMRGTLIPEKPIRILIRKRHTKSRKKLVPTPPTRCPFMVGK